MQTCPPPPAVTEAWQQLCAGYRADEAGCVKTLLQAVQWNEARRGRITERAAELVAIVRGDLNKGTPKQPTAQPKASASKISNALDAFLREYGLSTREGVLLMCLAEALLRIPDRATADQLLRDKLGDANWERHLGHSDSLLVNVSTWALLLSGRILPAHELRAWQRQSASSLLNNHLLSSLGENVVRPAMRTAMHILGRQFVMGRTIAEALARADADKAETEYAVRHSFDMLGEAALTAEDAARYLAAYHQAIVAIGDTAQHKEVRDNPGISVKLSALHPRYHYSQHRRVVAELVPILTSLAEEARRCNIGLTVDAEEAHNLLLSLDIIRQVSQRPSLCGWHGLGLAVQAYQKRAVAVLHYLAVVARRDGRRWMVRLVKGAYWDSEIKLAQQQGLSGYAVFTHKSYTDISYLACAQYLLAERAAFYPQFATHNAHSISAVLELASAHNDFEFQRLHGMGEVLYRHLPAVCEAPPPCRVYAPVGSHEELLAYLVRRLLENGANTSFVNRLSDAQLPIADIVADPWQKSSALCAALNGASHPRIPLPRELYRPQRANAVGIDLSDPLITEPLVAHIASTAEHRYEATPLLATTRTPSDAQEPATSLAKPTSPPGKHRATRHCRAPANRERIVGSVREANEREVEEAVAAAVHAQAAWEAMRANARAQCLVRVADFMERDLAPLIALAIFEAGKTVEDAINEVREAVDFCRYYAACGREMFGAVGTTNALDATGTSDADDATGADGAMKLPGPTGEMNTLRWHGRGAFVCISPWNFPLAIFCGQVSAALMTANTVLAKPAEQTPLIAHYATQLFYEAGVPGAVLQLLPGGGEVGARLVEARHIAGVAFTGSTDTARAIVQSLTARAGPIVPLIAETGGLNAMIVDSSALPEQVVQDVVASAFYSAGQRCSALRVLYVQKDIAARVLQLLQGHMAELQIGAPGELATDIGPVIDDAAVQQLAAHERWLAQNATLVYRCALPAHVKCGTFFAPSAWCIGGIDELQHEVFGPILHIVQYKAGDLARVVDDINDSGYGLTLGIHSRINTTVERIVARARVGNVYVNRNQTGAVVGSQPFGGEGLSGTGPKAGGPNYLQRFAVERSLCINTTAQGGNATLMTMEE